jgi:hypothetical protein
MSSISLHLLLTGFKHLCSDSSTAELRAAIPFDAKAILIDFIQFPNELRFDSNILLIPRETKS